MERLQKRILPVYNNPSQVERCVASMLGCSEKSCQAALFLSIGWNGTGFATSTDWKILTPSARCVLPPAVVPQYPTFITIKAGMNVDYTLDKEWQITRDNKDAVIVLNGKEFVVKNGEPVEIEISPQSKNFVLSDCEVIEEELSDKRVYRIITDDNTQYGEYVNGAISLI